MSEWNVAKPSSTMPAGKTVFLHANQTVMVFHPNGQLEFPLLATYPDSVKDAATVLCEHVSAAHKSLTAENARLTARIKRLEEALRPFAELAEARDKAAVVYLRGTDEAASKNSSDTELAALFAPDSDVVITDGALVSPREVTWGAFRRARAAYKDEADA